MTSRRLIVRPDEIQTITFACTKCRGRIAYPLGKSPTPDRIPNCPVCNEDWDSPMGTHKAGIKDQAIRFLAVLTDLRRVKSADSPFEVMLEIDEPASEREQSAE